MIVTTIEQSLRLIELGLKKTSSDLYYCKGHRDELEVIVKHENLDDEDIVAWSLDALVNEMPKEIKEDDKKYGFHLETTHNLYYVSYYRYDIDGIWYLHTTEMCDCTIDAAYEMVCWLLENGYIKKEKDNG